MMKHQKNHQFGQLHYGSFMPRATEEVLGILVISGIVPLPTLLPVAITDHRVKSDNTTSNGTFSDLGKLSMGHVKAYKHIFDLRAMALMCPVVKPEQFVVLVRDIPPTPDGNPEGTRPMNRTRFLGLVGKKVDNTHLRKLLPFLKVVVDKKIVSTVPEAYLPQIALIVFLALLPKLLLFLSKAGGIPSESQVVRTHQANTSISRF
ncbi:hypothetical protein Nepgr_008393 [Nepenthes gracilis]|uniref:CSC1/OSCA1-like 7TM region domain-containing protein n=1 Tax=Nepenthes gracilis TaxID=150966 RepID=A0AAD3XJ81_NEPGR|nr:hypothetical protein Nepgr_008393 [Nepenthes gracilis]